MKKLAQFLKFSLAADRAAHFLIYDIPLVQLFITELIIYFHCRQLIKGAKCVTYDNHIWLGWPRMRPPSHDIK